MRMQAGQREALAVVLWLIASAQLAHEPIEPEPKTSARQRRGSALWSIVSSQSSHETVGTETKMRARQGVVLCLVASPHSSHDSSESS